MRTKIRFIDCFCGVIILSSALLCVAGFIAGIIMTLSILIERLG